MLIKPEAAKQSSLNNYNTVPPAKGFVIRVIRMLLYLCVNVKVNAIIWVTCSLILYFDLIFPLSLLITTFTIFFPHESPDLKRSRNPFANLRPFVLRWISESIYGSLTHLISCLTACAATTGSWVTGNKNRWSGELVPTMPGALKQSQCSPVSAFSSWPRSFFAGPTNEWVEW